jgi:hypothetical protein
MEIDLPVMASDTPERGPPWLSLQWFAFVVASTSAQENKKLEVSSTEVNGGSPGVV